MAFTTEQLLLPPGKVAQLEKALTTLEVDDPLQLLCTEAAADVARMTAGYVLDEVSQRTFIRSLVLFRAYSAAGTGVPPQIQTDYDAAMKELEAIAKGERPNLPKETSDALTPIAGKAGSLPRIKMRTEPE